MLLYEKKKNTLTVKLRGELDHSVAAGVRAELDELILDPGVRRLVFDLNGLEFMDSSGIGMIMGRYKNIRFAGGTVLAVRVNERIRRILTLSGVYKYIDIYEELPKHSEVF